MPEQQQKRQITYYIPLNFRNGVPMGEAGYISLASHNSRALEKNFYQVFFFAIPLIIFALLFSLAPTINSSRESDTGSLTK